MVTKEEMDSMVFEETSTSRPAYMVNADDMAFFDEDTKNLPNKVDMVINEYCARNGFKRINSVIADSCHTNEKTFREYLNGHRPITRQFLYKLTIGLSLTLEEANELFDMCGGTLRRECREDYIVMKGIKDQDEIDAFIKNFNENVLDSSKIK